MAGAAVATAVTRDTELLSRLDEIGQGGVLQPIAHPQSVCPGGGDSSYPATCQGAGLSTLDIVLLFRPRAC